MRLLIPALLLAACGPTDPPSPPAATAASPGALAAASPGALAPPSPEGGPAPSGPAASLAGVCPERVVIQTDWFPEAEYGAVYELIGEPAVIDAARKTVSGPLVSRGQPTGVQVEVRTGGPAIGYQKVISQLRQDPSILLGFVTTDEAVENFPEIPTVAVVAPLEKNPQVIFWDPQTWPDARTIADLRPKGVRIRYFPATAYMEYLVDQGVVDAAQLDGSHDGSPAVFVAEGGRIAQQGFASSELYTFEHELPQWGRPLAYELIHDTGWEVYSQPLAVLRSRLEEARPCLARLVPIVQRAAVDFVGNPAETNGLIVRAVREFKDFWLYSEGIAAFSVAKQRELGLVGNGPDGTLGNFDLDRVARFLPRARKAFAARSLPELKPEDIVTNEFIDPAIGLP